MISSLDSWVQSAALASRSDAATSFFKLITHFGDVSFLGVATLIVCGYLWWKKSRELALLIACAMFFEVAIVFVLKELVARERPDAMLRLVAESDYSFPSGHATGATVFYFLNALLIPCFIKRRLLMLAAASLLVALIAVSRVYLGVHYATDVIAGIAVGSAIVYVAVLHKKKILSFFSGTIARLMP